MFNEIRKKKKYMSNLKREFQEEKQKREFQEFLGGSMVEWLGRQTSGGCRFMSCSDH